MELTIASLLDVVDRLGWIGGRTDLLTYPEYIIFKGIDTIIDEKRIRLGLKLNVEALPFNPQAILQKSLTIDQEENNEEKQEEKQVTSTKINTNRPTQTQEKWVEVIVKKDRGTQVKEDEMKKEKERLDKRVSTKTKANRYQDLKEREEEDENRIEEDSRVEIKMKEIDNLEEEKASPITYEINKMTLKEVEKVCKQNIDNTPIKDKAKKSEEEAGISTNEAAVIEDRKRKPQQENKELTKDDIDVHKKINSSSEAIEAKKEETYRKGHQNVKREILLHEKNKQKKSIRYQNDLLLFRLEQAEDKEKHLKNEIQAMKEEEETLKVKKIAALESALKKKTELLVNALKEKGKQDFNGRHRFEEHNDHR